MSSNDFSISVNDAFSAQNVVVENSLAMGINATIEFDSVTSNTTIGTNVTVSSGTNNTIVGANANNGTGRSNCLVLGSNATVGGTAQIGLDPELFKTTQPATFGGSGSLTLLNPGTPASYLLVHNAGTTFALPLYAYSP
jgi:hypothetical protein